MVGKLGWQEISGVRKEIVRTLVGKVCFRRFCHNYTRAINQILKVYSLSLHIADPDEGRK